MLVTELTRNIEALSIEQARGEIYLFNSMLYGIKPNDAIIFISIPLFLAFVALLASYIASRRATKLDPINALRDE